MKKVSFKSYTLLLSEKTGKTFEDMLKQNNIKYNIREINMHNLKFSIDVTQFHCYELTYIKKDGSMAFAYSFVIGFVDEYKCITFVSDNKLTDDDVIELEKLMSNDELKIEIFADKKFSGFDKFMNLLDLEGKYIIDKYGNRYEFNNYKWFPEGMYGKVIYDDGEERETILIKTHLKETPMAINVRGNGWKFLNQTKIMELFGGK